ncbi:MAG TPA: EAL domain-containing protein [Planctomycetota bacterium]|nr:EAL domain-containing protein [Planctomycetota bacterium]
MGIKSASEAHAEGARAPTPGRVLVVDDEPALLRVYVRLLRGQGYIVHRASDGNSALALLAEKHFDVIVSDIAMPGMDGLALLRVVRQRDLDVPVVLMTGDPTVETSIRALEYGALRYLVKPFEDQELLDVVALALRLHELARLKRQALDLLGVGGKQVGDLAGLGASLDRALESMWMAYQPIVSWSEKRIFAFEALLRTNEASLPTPGAVLEAAERLGRLPEVGRAIRDRVACSVELAPAKYVFVNLHTLDLLDDALYSPTAPLSQIAKRVVLEITERTALDGVTDVNARIAALRRLGFQIAVDDLGAGYAGLTSFAQLEPDVVKFDMSLIRGVHENPKKQKLIRSMTALFREMDLVVIAEGVESSLEREVLVEIGCDLLQGYAFAKPGKAFPSVSWQTAIGV